MNADQFQNILFLARQGFAARVIPESTQILVVLSQTLDAGEQALAKMRAHEAEVAKQTEAAKKTAESEKAAAQVLEQAHGVPRIKKPRAPKAAPITTVAKEDPGP